MCEKDMKPGQKEEKNQENGKGNQGNDTSGGL